MANPVLVECPKDEWTPVASSLTIGEIHVVDTQARYFYTYRVAGDPAPTDDGEEGVLFLESVKIPDIRAIDMYVYCKVQAGKVRTDKPQQQMSFTEDSLNIHDADIHDAIFLHFIAQETGISTTVAVAADKNDYQLTVADPAGWAVGNHFDLNFGTVHEHIYRQITDITGSVFDLDSRLDNNFPIGSILDQAEFGFNVVGTMANPQIFSVPVRPIDVLHITAVHFAFVHKAAADDTKFAGIPPLDNGLVLRVNRNNGESYQTLLNWKVNSEIKLDAGSQEVVYNQAAPAGDYGTAITFDLKHIAESIIRLDGANNDTVEILVQDDLFEAGDMVDAKAKLIGHFEGTAI
jgi:hypothetical protein